MLHWFTHLWYGEAAAASFGDTAPSALTASIQGWAQPDATIAGAASVPLAKATRLRNSPATLTGSGTITTAYPRGRARPTCTISIGAQPSATDIAEAVVAQKVHGLGPGTVTLGQVLGLLTRVARNRTVTDPVAGTITVYDDDDATPLFVADLWDDAAGTTPYSGAGADRRDRLE